MRMSKHQELEIKFGPHNTLTWNSQTAIHRPLGQVVRILAIPNYTQLST